ncbi:DUF2513 domain-containing protein [Nitrobacter hamburgensis]|nr:DUF2513 domain-containing protein [Nitrobacter hamburgensis]
MKLEVDLVRQLLLHIEEHATRPISDLDSIKIDGWTKDQIDYHVVLLADAVFIEAGLHRVPDNEDPSLVRVIYSVRRLTYNGHEFLETVRDPAIWRKVKEKAKAVGAMTLPAIAQIGAAYVKAQLGLG